jgi:glucose-1-phosphate adenylyltransferase
MVPGLRRSADPNRVVTIILGGGQGTRLFPLTRERAKPAVPLAGMYRLVDIPISNSINSEMRRIFILTQFLSMSLRRHVYESFKFDQFGGGFVEILAAEQTLTDASWYLGTADAVRRNLVRMGNLDFDWALILSGDQLYRMDFRQLLEEHVGSSADLTIAATPVTGEEVRGFGVMQIGADRRIVRYVEKPADSELLASLRLDPASRAHLGIPEQDKPFLASMGIYIINRHALFRLLENASEDFGRDVIPQAIDSHRVAAFLFQGYWEDIGTIRSFFEANIDLTSDLPRFNLFDMRAPIYTHPRFLPPSKINGATIDHGIISDGCIINQCRIESSIVGLRSLVDAGSHIRRTIIMGADSFESEESVQRHAAEGWPRIGIGRNTHIDGAIIDKNARIGDQCTITSRGKPETMDHPLYYVRDGIVIIPKDAVIPHRTII